jgi:hypothetical protein
MAFTNPQSQILQKHRQFSPRRKKTRLCQIIPSSERFANPPHAPSAQRDTAANNREDTAKQSTTVFQSTAHQTPRSQVGTNADSKKIASDNLPAGTRQQRPFTNRTPGSDRKNRPTVPTSLPDPTPNFHQFSATPRKGYADPNGHVPD